MAEAQFPPPTVVPHSVRAQEIEGTRFLAVRKAASELYTNQDGTALMSYGDTLLDRQKVKDTVLGYELAKGWIIDDRGQVTGVPAQVVSAPPAAPQIPTAPAIGFQTPAPVQPMQFPVPPAGAMAMPTAMQMTTSVPLTPQTLAPAPQAPPDAPMEMPIGKARRGRPAALGSAVAPPPPAPSQQLATPVQPQMVMQPPVPQPTMVMQAPMPPPMPPMPQTQAAPSGDFGALAKSLSDFTQSVEKFQATSAGDFKQFVGNLSAQINETNKALTDIQANQKKQGELIATSFVALHHLYLHIVQGPNKPAKLDEFEALLKQYLPR